MSNSRQRTGDYGERLAAEYLRQQHYRIVDTKWRCAYGEIDIVAQKSETLVFVEVRTRRSRLTSVAFASVTPAKQEKLVRAVHTYLHEHKLDEQTLWRIDVIAIALVPGRKPQIDHAEDALGW